MTNPVPARKPRPTDVIFDAEIADLMGVTKKSVQQFRWRDERFPSAVTPPDQRSPGFLRSDVEAYIKARAGKPSADGKKPVGRPPRRS